MIVAAIALALLFVLSAFFSGSETILFSLTGQQRARIRERSAKADAMIGECLGDSAMLLSTLLVGNTFVNFAAATVGYNLCTMLMPGYGAFLAVPIMTILLLVFGEITPKRYALRYAEHLAPGCARLMLFWRALLAPFNLAFRFSSRAFSKALQRERRALSDAELISVLDSAAEKGDFAESDAEMIEGVLRLSELYANDEMTPRVDIEGFDLDYPEHIRKQNLAKAHHRYLPIYRRTPDSIDGVIDRKTGKIMDALFVPEQVTLDDLLLTLRRSKMPLAIVTDEYGGTAGMITLNDIMEIILGPQVFDSAAGEEPRIEKKADNVWIIDGDANLDEINRELDLELEAEDADRLAGWIAAKVERIPHVGQTIVADGCRATILKKKKRRVMLVRLEIVKHPEVDTDDEIIAETDEAVQKTEEENR